VPAPRLIDPPLPGAELERLGGLWFRQLDFLRALAISPDGRTMAAAGSSSIIHMWDVVAGREFARILSLDEGERALAFSADGRRLAAAGSFVTMFDLASGRMVWRMPVVRPFEAHAVAVSPDGQLVASAEARIRAGTQLEGVVRIRNAADGKLQQTLVYGGEGGDWGTAAVAFSPDSRWVAAGGCSEGVKVWEADTGREVHSLPGPQGWIRTVAFSPDGKVLAAGGERGTIWLWDTASGREIRRLEVRDKDDVGWLAFVPGGSTLVAAGYDGQVRIWDSVRGKEQGSFPLRGRYRDRDVTVALAPEGWIAEATSRVGMVRVYDLAAALPVPGNPELETHWTDLGAADALVARRAARALADRPGPAIELLAAKLRPASPSDTRRFSALLAALDDDRFDAREQAEDELRRVGAAAEPALRKLLSGRFSAEARARAERLLERLEPVGFPSTDPELRRSLRALKVLGEIGTPEARALLDRLAAGAAEATLTLEARAVLARLAAGR
jgi:WD40 repeat protein